MKYLYIFAVVLGAVILYVAWVVITTIIETKGAPREEMFLCPKHGPIRAQHCIQFQSSSDTWVKYCSICFHERLTNAEKV